MRKLKIHYAFLGGHSEKKNSFTGYPYKNMSWSWTCLDLNPKKKTGKIVWWWCIHPFRINRTNEIFNFFRRKLPGFQVPEPAIQRVHPSDHHHRCKKTKSHGFFFERMAMTIYKTCYLLFTSYDNTTIKTKIKASVRRTTFSCAVDFVRYPRYISIFVTFYCWCCFPLFPYNMNLSMSGLHWCSSPLLSSRKWSSSPKNSEEYHISTKISKFCRILDGL